MEGRKQERKEEGLEEKESGEPRSKKIYFFKGERHERRN